MKDGERQVAPTLAGIRKDHVARYKFAALMLPPEQAVIDFACGVGYGARLMAAAGHSVDGYDCNQEALDYAKKHYDHSRAIYRAGDGNAPIGLGVDDYDAAVCFETIEHIEDPRPLLKALQKSARRLKYCDEVWTINALGDVLACDRVFHMDDVRIQEIRAAAEPDSNIAAMLAWMKTAPGPDHHQPRASRLSGPGRVPARGRGEPLPRGLLQLHRRLCGGLRRVSPRRARSSRCSAWTSPTRRARRRKGPRLRRVLARPRRRARHQARVPEDLQPARRRPLAGRALLRLRHARARHQARRRHRIRVSFTEKVRPRCPRRPRSRTATTTRKHEGVRMNYRPRR
jgi:SAM-dependent methyltransferase